MIGCFSYATLGPKVTMFAINLTSSNNKFASVLIYILTASTDAFEARSLAVF